ncbi:hypothetical protein RJ640_025099 [Escallonia rubra]|uniref:peptidylprolyl isomerase n=1 Tax=Escallonia rubra TaxID=112253 RepID=A0AA88RZB9_9ASTE|nr:hypothetical protein RJ640_025099 [Escallonia rubra]
MEVSTNKPYHHRQAAFSNLPEIDIGNQGLRKRILQKGTSWQTPFPGDEVEVHYSVSLKDGAYIDSSHDKKMPFRFKLGQHEVIKGWDEGIGTMKKGERAVFTIPPELAYGHAGSPPIIPPDATLVFDIEMVSWNTIRDITGDGGVLKKIVEEGEGWATPREDDEVLVKYEVRLENGAVASKSSEGVEFCLTNGYLCPAMSKAARTMRKGEKAELSVKFSYGCRLLQKGDTRNGDDIPPNANFVIHLELVSWKSVVDIMGDKKILKKIIKVGEGYDRPSEGSVAKVRYIGKREDGAVFERKGHEAEAFEYLCSEEQINEGLDRAIMTMRKGEHAIVTVGTDFLYGYKEFGSISANSVIVYEVELVDFTKEKPFWKMDTIEKIEACERKKNEGNILFKAGKLQRASRKYAIKYIEFDHTFNDVEKCQSNALRLSCNLNNAACKLKLEQYPEASRLCSEVLELDPSNVKALFRRSQAYLRTSQLENAEADIKRALSIDPDSREVKLGYKELKEKRKQYVRYEAEICSTMLSKMG